MSVQHSDRVAAGEAGDMECLFLEAGFGMPKEWFEGGLRGWRQNKGAVVGGKCWIDGVLSVVFRRALTELRSGGVNSTSILSSQEQFLTKLLCTTSHAIESGIPTYLERS